MLSIQSVMSSAFVAVTLLASATASYADASHDLADRAAGSYHGDIISDARGSSQSNVTITVTKTGHNVIRITSDNARIPAHTFKLEKDMNTIQNNGGAAVFLLDLDKSPASLNITIDDAAYAGTKAGD